MFLFMVYLRVNYISNISNIYKASLVLSNFSCHMVDKFVDVKLRAQPISF